NARDRAFAVAAEVARRPKRPDRHRPERLVESQIQHLGLIIRPSAFAPMLAPPGAKVTPRARASDVREPGQARALARWRQGASPPSAAAQARPGASPSASGDAD